jgi:hypothetical protein
VKTAESDARGPELSRPAIPVGKRVDTEPLAVDDRAKGYDGLELDRAAGCQANRNDRIESDQGRGNAQEEILHLG